MTPQPERICDGVTLYEGDCLDVIGSLEGFLYVLTDPPYGIALSSHGTRFRAMTGPIVGDESCEVGTAVLDACRARGWPVMAFADPSKPWPGKWRQELVWDKGEAVGIGGDRATCWKFSWELIQVGQFPGVSGPREGAVLRHHINAQNYAHHPAAKPLGLMRYLVRKLVPVGGTLFDPFAGSGTALVAAQMEGRSAIGCEIDPAHCATIRRRVLHATGTGPGSLFAESNQEAAK